MEDKRGRVLFVSHDASRTGASIFLLRLLRWLRANYDFDAHILAGSPGELTADFESLGRVDSFEPDPTPLYKVLRRLRLNDWSDSNHLAGLRERLSRSNIRLVYANSVASARMVDFLSFLKCPVICHVHELDGAIQSLGSRNISLLEKYRPVYIAVSHAVKQNLTAAHGIPANRIQTIHGFIPVSEMADTRADSRDMVRRELGIPEQARIVCGCGSIEHRKGTDLFLQVAKNVVQRSSSVPVHFVWIGGKRQTVNDMRRQVVSAGLGGVVHFTGSRSNVAPYFEAADVFVLTSREDPFPLVMLEAALHGKPTVCFGQTGGAAEFLQGDAGYIVPKFDVAKMSDRVVDLLVSPNLRARMGATARQRVVNSHDLSVGAARIAHVIEEAFRSGPIRDLSLGASPSNYTALRVS
jgi:glycosyltransferase involved in cell wall biosynthesis